MKFQKPNQKKMTDKSKKEKKIPGSVKSPLNKDLQKMVDQHFRMAEKGMDEYLDWAFKEVMPRYDRYLLGQKMKSKEYKNLLGIAEVFLDICAGLGFLEFDNLHPGFVESFPDLFKESVVGPKISKEEVKKCLDSFLNFLEIYYAVQMNKVFF
jgi:hypothetical protein